MAHQVMSCCSMTVYTSDWWLILIVILFEIMHSLSFINHWTLWLWQDMMHHTYHITYVHMSKFHVQLPPPKLDEKDPKGEKCQLWEMKIMTIIKQNPLDGSSSRLLMLSHFHNYTLSKNVPIFTVCPGYYCSHIVWITIGCRCLGLNSPAR